jgi:hypothetical protein
MFFNRAFGVKLCITQDGTVKHVNMVLTFSFGCTILYYVFPRMLCPENRDR